MDGQIVAVARQRERLRLRTSKGLVHDNEGIVHAAVVDLRQASRSFKELAREVRQRPSRLLFFGGSQGDRKLP